MVRKREEANEEKSEEVSGNIGISAVMAILSSLNKPKTHSLEIGNCYFFRTVTYHTVGRLVAITDTDLVLEDATWVASSGRYSTFLEKGVADECEMIPKGTKHRIMRESIVDYNEWHNPVPLPTSK